MKMTPKPKQQPRLQPAAATTTATATPAAAAAAAVKSWFDSRLGVQVRQLPNGTLQQAIVKKGDSGFAVAVFDDLEKQTEVPNMALKVMKRPAKAAVQKKQLRRQGRMRMMWT